MTDQTTAPRGTSAPRGFLLRKKRLLGGGALLVALVVLSRAATPTNVAQTDESAEDTRLHPRLYSASPEKVAGEIRALAPQLSTYGKSWKIKSATSPSATSQDAHALGVSTRGAVETVGLEVPVLVFTDDLVATLFARDGGASTRVEARSASRVGKSDFGENRRHIIQFLAALDTRLGENRPTEK